MGFESPPALPNAGKAARSSDADARSPALESSRGQSGGNEPPADPVEQALADAITKAAAAGQWSAVEALSAELKARREARANVIVLDAARRRGGRP